MPRSKKNPDNTRQRKVGWCFFAFQIVLLTILWLLKVNYAIENQTLILAYLFSTVFVLVTVCLYDQRAAEAAFDVLSPI